MNPLFLFLLLPLGAQATTVCDATEFGAKPDGITKNTVAIQAAIDHCWTGGGGTVVLHGGVFLSGMIRLKSNITLQIDPGATLKGTQDDADYPDTHPQSDNSQLNNCRKTLVYAEKAHNVTIEGGGTIDGNGNKPEWIGPNTKTPERSRPMAIFLVQSQNVLLQNIHVRDAGAWGVVNFENDDVTIRGLDIHTDLFGNRDGIDVVDCHRVLIENNTIFSEDDSICLKSGTARGVEDVMVRNNHVLQSTVANGLKLGTASSGGFKNVTFENNDVKNVDKAVMTVEAIDGAKVENITFKGITFSHSGTPFFVLLGRRKGGSKDGSNQPLPVGSIDGVHFENIQGQAMKHVWGSAISGTVIDGVRYAPKNITFDHVNVTFQGDSQLKARPPSPPEYAGQYPDPNIWGDLPASGIYIRHVDGLSIQNSHFETAAADARSTVVEVDLTHASEP